MDNQPPSPASAPVTPTGTTYVPPTPPPANPSPVTPPPSPTLSKTRSGMILMILLVILLGIAGGGYIYYMNMQKTQSTPQPSSEAPRISTSPTNVAPTYPPSTESATNKKVILLSDAWNLGTKTYTNPKLGITFSYPSYFLITDHDLAKENADWAKMYKNNPTVKPLYDDAQLVVTTFDSHNPADSVNNEICANKMTVTVSENDNPQNLSLYDFIADQNKTYPGNGVTESFDMYKKNLKESQLPKTGSYVFEGNMGENPVKVAYFENKNNVYTFFLRGNCDTGGQYSPAANTIFEQMLKSVKFSN